jgi:ribosomal protein S18 acetylase RimI-like enzyme
MKHTTTKLLCEKDVDQFLELLHVFENVFEIKNFSLPDKAYLGKQLAKKDFMAFVAMKDYEVVGGLTSYTLSSYYSEKPSVYIYDLAVKTDLQRQGIGRLLISDFSKVCQHIGAKEFFVQADYEDKHALDFYRSTGAKTELKAIHFSYTFL